MKEQNGQPISEGKTEAESVFLQQNGEEESSPQNAEKALRRRRWDKIVTVLLCVAVFLLVTAVVLKLFFFGYVTVSGASMMPNFVSGQKVWVSKTATPNRGDVVVFYANGDASLFDELTGDGGKGGVAEKYIKRVVALAGDKIWAEKHGEFYVLTVQTAQGEVLHENYYTVGGTAAKFYADPLNKTFGDIPLCNTLGNLIDATESNPYVVPDGCFYALGDNRFNSNDSRAFGAVPYTRIFGVVI